MIRFLKLFFEFFKYDNLVNSISKAWVCKDTKMLQKKKKPDFDESEIYKP